MTRFWAACALLAGIGCAGCSGELGEKQVEESLHACLGPEWPILKVGPLTPNPEGNELKAAFEFRIGQGQGVDASISIPGRAEYRRDPDGTWYLTRVISKTHDEGMRRACVVPFRVE
jgi:hypothetical protein